MDQYNYWSLNKRGRCTGFWRMPENRFKAFADKARGLNENNADIKTLVNNALIALNKAGF